MKKISIITSIVLSITLLIFTTGYQVAKKYDIVFQSPVRILPTGIVIEQATFQAPLEFEEREDVFALLNEEIN